MAFNDAGLQEQYQLTAFRVRSSTQISNRTAAVIDKLRSGNASKTPLVVLSAEAKAAGKLISIVEIAKRELLSENIKVHQYNSLASKLVEIDRNPRPRESGRRENASPADEGESDDAFETMGLPTDLGPTRKRNMPIMTIYLAIAPVRELNAAFGEQLSKE